MEHLRNKSHVKSELFTTNIKQSLDLMKITLLLQVNNSHNIARSKDPRMKYAYL
jgi:hypothetical protein